MQQLLASDPDNQEMHYFAAHAAYGSGQYERAQKLVDRYMVFHSVGYHRDKAVKLKAAIEEALGAFAASEKAAFEYAQRQHTIFAYAAFRDAYPNSSNVGNADFMSFRRAKEVNVEISYQRYLQYWPEGKFKTDALRSADLAAFREARQQNTILSYTSYLSTYPKGTFADQARAREEALAFSIATADGTPGALEAFLVHYPRGAYRNEAIRSLKLAEEKAPLRSLTGPTKLVPAGMYIYRRPATRAERNAPQVFEISSPFHAMVYEVTFEMWDRCTAEGGCTGPRPDDEGWGRVRRPVVNVGRLEIEEFTRWLNGRWRVAGGEGTWRLPSEVEWAYMARGMNGLVTLSRAAIEKAGQACADCDDKAGADATFPVGRFTPNSFGLYDMLGNVAEWTADCWDTRFGAAPVLEDCQTGVVRGTLDSTVPLALAAQARQAMAVSARHKLIGFRLVRAQ